MSRTSAASACVFCDEFAGTPLPKDAIRAGGESRLLLENRHAAVIAAISPLATGHVLTLPRRHCTATAHLSDAERGDLLDAHRHVSAAIESRYGPVFSWEHGVGEGREGGCGITHAHIHALPMSAEGRRALSAAVRQWAAIQELTVSLPLPSVAAASDLVDRDASFLWWDDGDEVRLVVSESLPSQLLRRLAAEVLAVESWDWRSFSNWDAFGDTVRELAGSV